MSNYPSNFDRLRAIELGKLVDTAYAQFTNRANPDFQWQPIGYQIDPGILTASEDGAIVPFGYIATKGTDAYVVIRGTIQPLEWLDDATIVQVPFRQGWGNTTKGFYTLYNQLSPEIIGILKKLNDSGAFKQVFVTGHSLGAALAHLAAADIFITFGGTVVPISFTFSGPRTGDPSFVTAFATSGMQTWRIFNTEDIVPALPLSTPDVNPAAQGLEDTMVELAFKLLIKTGAAGLFTHLPTPIPLTYNKDDIADNHNLTTLYSSL